eukprot:TRINITY_DN1569_c0_g1_i2.p1 TRINITY_DN1569_c0_g1~~TRINITY_DN1569_c0_g1_i2.p1  ORF type:complete len:260 (+),score=45.72 TRINITY_DN1569_c0_g1_i2:34-813(+)
MYCLSGTPSAVADRLKAQLQEELESTRASVRGLQRKLDREAPEYEPAEMFGSPLWFKKLDPDNTHLASSLRVRSVQHEPGLNEKCEKEEVTAPKRKVRRDHYRNSIEWNQSTYIEPCKHKELSAKTPLPSYGGTRAKSTFFYEKYNHKTYTEENEAYRMAHSEMAHSGALPSKRDFIQDTLHTKYNIPVFGTVSDAPPRSFHPPPQQMYDPRECELLREAPGPSTKRPPKTQCYAVMESPTPTTPQRNTYRTSEGLWSS